MEDPSRGRKALVGEVNDHSARKNIEKSSSDKANDLDVDSGKGAFCASEKDPSDSTSKPLPQKKRRNRRKNRKSKEHRQAQPNAQDAESLAQKSDGSGKNQGHKGHNRKRTHSQKTPLYAALDLGTNNCRLLVARPTRAGQFEVVDAFSRIVRLGEGLASSGMLSQNAMDRAIGALRICASKLARYNIKKYRLIATEACRQASNGESFLERVKLETGLNLELINRETEAQLAVSGCASLVERHTQSIVLFDIGGGSSEIAAIDFEHKRTPRLANHIKSWTSLPVGVVTLSEKHGGKDVTPEVFKAMVEEVEELFAETAPQSLLDFDPDLDSFHLLGTSGTVTTLAGIHLELPRYDRRKVDGLWLQKDDVDNILDRLLGWDISERSKNPCIGPDRSDLVLAGCAIMQAIRNKWPCERMRVADRGLREGLLNDMMAKDGVWRRRRRNSNRYQGSKNRRRHFSKNRQQTPTANSNNEQ